MILWDPVVRGSVYLQDLARLHSTWTQSGGRSGEEELASYPDAVLGFTLSPVLRGELAAADVLQSIASRWGGATLHVVVSEQTAETTLLTQCVRSKYGDSAMRFVSEPAGWQEPDLIHTALAAPQTLQSIAAWLSSSEAPHEVPVRPARV